MYLQVQIDAHYARVRGSRSDESIMQLMFSLMSLYCVAGGRLETSNGVMLFRDERGESDFGRVMCTESRNDASVLSAASFGSGFFFNSQHPIKLKGSILSS